LLGKVRGLINCHALPSAEPIFDLLQDWPEGFRNLIHGSV
jgi:hypothetical protein